MAAAKKKLIIDCDPGVDDALAILVALSQPSVELLAITCVTGNVALEKVAINVMKILELCQRTDIPVYKGASVALLGQKKDRAASVHGEDGLGDVEDIKNPDLTLLKTEHAANALVRLTTESAGKITIVAIGPLTNIALACRLDPNFPSRLEHVVIMGGNIEATGNASVSSEFNFHQDPEAAYIVLNELVCQPSIVTFEICRKHAFDWEFYEKFINLGTRKADFVKNISRNYSNNILKNANYVKFGLKFYSYDEIAMAVALRPDVVLQKESIYSTVELKGHYTSGQMIVDWRDKLKRKHNITLIHKIDIELMKQLMIQCLL